MLLAKVLATLDQLTQGRLIVGGALGENTTPYAVFGGHEPDRPQRLEVVDSYRLTTVDEEKLYSRRTRPPILRSHLRAAGARRSRDRRRECR